MGHGLQIEAAPPERLPYIYDQFATLFQQFADRFPDETPLPEIVADIMGEQYQLWLVTSETRVVAFALTFVKSDARKTCVISHCAGKAYEQWAGDLLATIRVWSASLGSTKLEIVARPGWERALRRFGMVRTQVVLELKGPDIGQITTDTDDAGAALGS